MEAIGVRELRRDASRWLAGVRDGEVFVVTDRGRPVAKLSPIAQAGDYEALLVNGRIAPGPGRSIAEVLADLDGDLPPDEGPSVCADVNACRRALNGHLVPGRVGPGQSGPAGAGDLGPA
ncbi:MAG: type II toxin-antitoxin system Phd/YefM family antitoxin [Acidimicrobiales bacterium]